MLDLETLGSRPGCPIFAVGAARFSAEGVGGSFLALVRPDWARAEPDSAAWWREQSGPAREQLDLAERAGSTLREALLAFRGFFHAVPLSRLWGRGPDFDCALLAEAYAAEGLERPWDFRQVRCHRTIEAVGAELGAFAPARAGAHHRADDDARHQAAGAAAALAAVARCARRARARGPR